MKCSDSPSGKHEPGDIVEAETITEIDTELVFVCIHCDTEGRFKVRHSKIKWNKAERGDDGGWDDEEDDGLDY